MSKSQLIQYVLADENSIAAITNVKNQLVMIYSIDAGNTFSQKTIYEDQNNNDIYIHYFGKVNNKYVIIYTKGTKTADIDMLESSTLTGNYTLHEGFIKVSGYFPSYSSLMYANGKYIIIFSSDVDYDKLQYIAFSTSLYSGYKFPPKPQNDKVSYNSNIVYNNGHYFYIHKSIYDSTAPGSIITFTDINSNGIIGYKAKSLNDFGQFHTNYNRDIMNELDVKEGVVYAKTVYASPQIKEYEVINLVTNIRVESGEIKCNIISFTGLKNSYYDSRFLKVGTKYIFIKTDYYNGGYLKIYSDKFTLIGTYVFNTMLNNNMYNTLYTTAPTATTYIYIENDELYFSLYSNNAAPSIIAFNIKNLPLPYNAESYNFIKATLT